MLLLEKGIITRKGERQEAEALAAALGKAEKQLEFSYTLMGAAALRYMVTEMDILSSEQDTIPIIVERGWQLQTDYIKTVECKRWRKQIAASLSKNQGSSTALPVLELWRAISRTIASVVTFAKMLQNDPDPEHTLEDRAKLMRMLFLGIPDLPWYPAQDIVGDEIRQSTLTKLFHAIAAPERNHAPAIGAKTNHCAIRKRLAIVFDLWRKYEYSDLKATPYNLFTHVKKVARLPSSTHERLLDILLQEFRSGPLQYNSEDKKNSETVALLKNGPLNMWMLPGRGYD